MKQTKLVSLIESGLNVGTGYIVSVIVYKLLAPSFGWSASWGQSAGLALFFTGSSLIRAYLWRRFFTNGLHNKLIKFYANK